MSTVSVKLPLCNKSDVPIPVQFNIARANGIIDGKNTYDAYLNKFFVSASSIQNMIIDDSNISEFFVFVKCDSDNIPITKQYLFKSSVYPMYSEKDVLDNINRNIAYNYMLYGAGVSPYSNIQYGPTILFSNTIKDVGFTVPQNILNYDAPYDFTLQVFAPTNLVGDPGLMTLQLKNDLSSQTVILTSEYDPATWGNVVFCDYGAYNPNNSNNPNNGGVYVQPQTPFSQLKNPSNTTYNTYGVWKLQCYSNRNPNAVYNFSISILFMIHQRTILGSETYRTIDSTIAPYIETSSDNYLQLRYPERWQTSSFSLYVSPVLNSMLGFSSTYSAVYGAYRINLPQIIVSNPINVNNMLLYKQPSTTVELLTDLEAIYVSTTLPVQREQDLSSLDGAETILTSYSIETFTRTSYNFVAVADNLRKYRLVNQTDIKQFVLYLQLSRRDFSDSGNTVRREPILIAPGCVSTVLISFIPS